MSFPTVEFDGYVNVAVPCGFSTGVRAFLGGFVYLMGAVEGRADLLEALVGLVGKIFCGIGGLFFQVVEAFADLLTGFGTFVGGDDDADGYTGENS